MAVFKLNNCIFENCGMVFKNLENLIWHIETNHINYDPKIIEQFEIQQPTCLPLSYVLRFFGDSTQTEEKDFSDSAEEKDTSDSNPKQTLPSPKTVQSKICTKIDSTSDAQEVSTAKSAINFKKNNNSWTNVKTNNSTLKNFCKMKKSFRCHCGKAYGSNSSLKKHAIQCHNAAVITAQVKEIFQQGTDGSSLNKLIQPYQSVSLKRLSTPNAPLKTLIVSTKATSTMPLQNTQQSPRLMIQLSDLHTLSS